MAGNFGVNGFHDYRAYINDQMPGDPLEDVVGYFASEAALIAQAGIRWDRTLSPSGGQFKRAFIEKSPGVYDWSVPDAFVKAVQQQGLALLALVQTWTSWDQSGQSEMLYGKPGNLAAWKAFVQNLVERYDGDGQGDMPGLRYGIKHWEIGNEPEMGRFNNGNPQDYFDTLKAAYEGVKAADPDSKVLSAGASPVYVPRSSELASQVVSFWQQVFALEGGAYMDVLTIHHTCPEQAPPLVSFLERFSGYGKEIWVTEFGTYSGTASKNGTTLPAQTEEYQASYLVKNSVAGFAHGMKKLFWTIFVAPKTAPPMPGNDWMDPVAMVKSDGSVKPVYKAQQVMSAKIDGFTSVQELGEGRYRFTVNGRPVYVLWGAGQLPSELSGQVLVTDLSGNETRVSASALTLTSNPVFVEQ